MTDHPTAKSNSPRILSAELASGAGGLSWRALAASALILTGLAVAFCGSFVDMWTMWFPAWGRTDLGLYDRLIEGDSYYTHAPLVPLVCIVIVYFLLRYTRIAVRPRPLAGTVVLVANLLLYLMAVVADVAFVRRFLFIGVLASLVLVIWGWGMLRRLWFPLVFLAFMTPLHALIIDDLNFRLKMLAADYGVRLANLLGVAAEQSGSMLYLAGDKTMVMGGVCSGLRTLISLTAFAALYAYVSRLSGVWRLGLFLMAVPVAIGSNCLRIVSLIIVGHVWGVRVATGWYHDSSGVLIFIIAFVLMFGIERLVLCVRRLIGRPAKIVPMLHGCRRGPQDVGQGARIRRGLGGAPAWVAGVLVLGSAAAGCHYSQVRTSMWNQEMVRQVLPMTIQINGASLSGRDLDLDKDTLTILQTSDYLYRSYEAQGASRVDVLVVFSENNRRGVHAPEICLAGAGDVIQSRGDVVIEGVGGWGSLPCRELVVSHGPSGRYFLYVYKSNSGYTPSYLRHQWNVVVRSFVSRRVGGSLIRVSTPIENGNLAQVRQRAMELMRIAIPRLDEVLKSN